MHAYESVIPGASALPNEFECIHRTISHLISVFFSVSNVLYEMGNSDSKEHHKGAVVTNTSKSQDESAVLSDAVYQVY